MQSAGPDQKFVYGVARDVTEQKRAEERLRASEEWYRLLFDANPLPSGLKSAWFTVTVTPDSSVMLAALPSMLKCAPAPIVAFVLLEADLVVGHHFENSP